MNLDCSSIVGPDGTALSGDMAARVLDLAGIVVNRNTIPGDQSAFDPSGIRMGTSWITQRGFGKKEVVQLADLIARLLKSCTPYALAGRKGPMRRTKVDYTTLHEVQTAVRDMALAAGIDYEAPSFGFPHFTYLDDPLPEEPFTLLELEGEAEALLRWTTSARTDQMQVGDSVKTMLAIPDGSCPAVLSRIQPGAWDLTLGREHAAAAVTWLRDLSDGYVALGEGDLERKLPGPVVVSVCGGLAEMPEADGDGAGELKPWFLRMPDSKSKALPAFTWDEPEDPPVKETALNATHRELGAKMVPFAGWDMPVWYSSVVEEHNATRNAAGLFDVSHMGVYQVEGPTACAFLDSVVTNEVASLAVGESLYAQFLDPAAAVIDDTMVYRRGEQAYLVVVNASNDDKDWAWLNAVLKGEVAVDAARPGAQAYGLTCTLRNLRDPSEGDEMRVDIALQGPKSREILLALKPGAETAARLEVAALGGCDGRDFRRVGPGREPDGLYRRAGGLRALRPSRKER